MLFGRPDFVIGLQTDVLINCIIIIIIITATTIIIIIIIWRLTR